MRAPMPFRIAQERTGNTKANVQVPLKLATWKRLGHFSEFFLAFLDAFVALSGFQGPLGQGLGSHLGQGDL